MQTALTRMLSFARSRLIALVSASPAARLTVVGSVDAGGVLAEEVEMLTMAPPPERRMGASAA
ncbi:hypothetical protein D3C73_1660020 [compost metagenome]